MKNVLLAALQFVLFLALFAAGNILPVFHVSWITTFANGTRGFQWIGLLLSLAAAVLIFVAEASRGRISKAGPWTSAAFLVAILFGLLKWQLGLTSIGR